MKIFLLNPEPPYFKSRLVMRRNRVWPPITLAIIAQGLERDGHHVRLLDANALHLNDAHIAREIRSFEPDLLVYSSDRHDAWQLPVPDNTYIKDFFKAYHSAGCSADTVILIGPHGTLFPDTMLKEIPAVDFVVRGEPELKTLDLVKALSEGEPRSAEGVSYIKQTGEVIHNEDPGFIEDLDVLPLPAYHLLPMDRYQDNTAPGHKFGLVVTSRGCPMACIFCSKSMYGSKFRTRSIDHVLEEIDLLVKRYGVTRFFFHDQILLLKRKRIEDLLHALVERRYALSWRCQTRLANLDEEILTLMKKTGCTEVHVGLESISKAVRKAVKKTDGDTEKFINLYNFGQKIGLSISPNMIIGLPGETYESVMESARFYHDLGFHFLANVAIPYPDTGLYEIGVKEGKIRGDDWSSIVDAAGVAGNTLEISDLERAIRDIEVLNRQLRLSKMSVPQKVMKIPGYILRRVKQVVKKVIPLRRS